MDHSSIEALARRVRQLRRANRAWRCTGAAVVLFASALLITLFPPARAEARHDAPATVQAGDPVAIVKSRLELARKALAIIRRKTALGPQVSHPVNDTYHWSVIQLGSQIYLSMAEDETKVESAEVYLAVAHARPNRERLAAFEAHRDLMKYWEDRLRPLADKTILAPLDFLEIQEHRLQAELWLARERANGGDRKQAIVR